MSDSGSLPPPGPGQPDRPSPEQPYPAPRPGRIGYGEPAYGQPTYGQPVSGSPSRPPASRTAAGWALGLAILPCFGLGWLVSIGLAISVLVKSADGRDHGRGLAIAALVIDALWFLVFVGIGIADVTGVLDDPSPSDSSSVSVLDLSPGQCFDGGPTEDGQEVVSEVKRVECRDPHHYEVFAREQIPGGDYPGVGQTAKLTEEMCIDKFGHFVGKPYDRSELSLVYFHPQARGWALGDHWGVCAVGEVTGARRTGTLHFARR